MRIQRGFTLVEILVTAALLSIIAGVLMSFLSFGQKTWENGSAQMVISTELRRALLSMSRELAESRSNVNWLSSPPADGRWYPSVVFKVPQDVDGDGTPFQQGTTNLEPSAQWITYRWFQPENQCRRVSGLQGTVVANSITQVRFRRLPATPDVVQIELTASVAGENLRTLTRTMGGRVKLRN